MRKSYKIGSKDGIIYTVREVVDILGRHKSTICKWFNAGITTLEELKTASVLRGKSKCSKGFMLYDTCKGRLSCNEVAAMAETSATTVYGRAKRHGWDSPVIFWPNMTRLELKERLIAEGLYIPTKKYNPHRIAYKHLIDEDTGAKLMYKEVAEILKMSPDSISSYVARHGCKTLQDCLARVEYLKKWPKGSLNVGAPKFIPPSVTAGKLKPNGKMFDRSVDCMRIDSHGLVTEKCKHYGKCSDSRVFKGRHIEGLYKVDGSCYVGVQLDGAFHQNTSGQETAVNLSDMRRK